MDALHTYGGHDTTAYYQHVPDDLWNAAIRWELTDEQESLWIALYSPIEYVPEDRTP